MIENFIIDTWYYRNIKPFICMNITHVYNYGNQGTHSSTIFTDIPWFWGDIITWQIVFVLRNRIRLPKPLPMMNLHQRRGPTMLIMTVMRHLLPSLAKNLQVKVLTRKVMHLNIMILPKLSLKVVQIQMMRAVKN